MYELIKKEYNPCGDLTGREREICDEATKNYFNLPFVEVMRAISIKNLAELENEKNFSNIDALKNWANYNLSDDERRANLNFNTFTPLQAGLSKYFVHVLFENRYNIHYNALINYCQTLDKNFFPNNLSEEDLKGKINSIAQQANHSATVNALIEEFLNFLAAF